MSSLSRTARDKVSTTQAPSKVRRDEHRSGPSYQVNAIVLVQNLLRRYQFGVRFQGIYCILRCTNHKTHALVQHVNLHHVIHMLSLLSNILPYHRRSVTGFSHRSLSLPFHLSSAAFRHVSLLRTIPEPPTSAHSSHYPVPRTTLDASTHYPNFLPSTLQPPMLNVAFRFFFSYGLPSLPRSLCVRSLFTSFYQSSYSYVRTQIFC